MVGSEGNNAAERSPGTGSPNPAVDPGALIRSKEFRRLLVLSAAIGVLVSLAAWCFLELIHALQQGVYEDLPDALGFVAPPWWWPLPVLALAGLIIAFAVVRLPGHGGHPPAGGLESGPPTTPVEIPGVLLAALASIGLGLVLGPEAPLIGLGTGLALLAVQMSKKDVPDQAKLVLVAAASFAALATIFGSPIIGAIIIIEAAGLGGPTLPLVLLPGLVAAGVGSLVFTGVGSLTGLSSNAYAVAPLSLPVYSIPQLSDFLWTIVLGIVAAVVTVAIIEIGRRTSHIVSKRPFVSYPLAAVVVALLAIGFSQITDQSAGLVLFSGQEAMNAVVQQAGTLALGTLVLIVIFKGLAWGVSLGGARGGPTFPAIFIGIVAGLLASHLPGLNETPAVGVLIGAMAVSVLRLPLSAIVIALIVSQAGAAAAPLIIVGVVVAYITVELVWARRSTSTSASSPTTTRTVGST